MVQISRTRALNELVANVQLKCQGSPEDTRSAQILSQAMEVLVSGLCAQYFRDCSGGVRNS